MTNLTWVLSSCALILAVIALRAAFGKRMRPGLRYALWGLVLLRLLYPGAVFSSPVSVESVAGQTEVVQNFEALRGVDYIERGGNGSVWGFNRYALMPETPVTVAEDVTPERFERMETTIHLRNILEPVWIMGIVVAVIAFFVSNTRFHEELRKRRKLLETDCPLRVYSVENLSSSCLFGNTIYVATETASDETKLRHVLAHELSHHRHGDHVWVLLRCAALALHWYNPLVWWAAALSRQDSELCADAGALRRLGEDERENYGATLIELSASRVSKASLLCTATTMTNGKKSLKERVTLIARRPRMTAAVVAAVVLIAAVAAGCAFAGAAERQNEAASDDPPEETVPSSEIDYANGDAEFDFAEGTVFTYNGVKYDVTEQYGGINAINDIRRVGKYLVIDGHVGSRNGMYGIFDTESETFVKSFPGAHLIWQDDDLSTAIYSFWSDILDYDGNVIAQLDLTEPEGIYSLRYSEDGEKIVVAIVSYDGDDRTEIYALNGEPAVIANDGDTMPVYSRRLRTLEFFNDIGKTLSELKNEHPAGEFIVSLDGFPDSAAVCFGEPGADYVYCFFVAQSGDFEKAVNKYEEQLKCAGFITAASILFPDMEDEMSFEDFFSLIGVEDYEYFVGEDTITAEGWLRFMYSGMEVMVNTNESAGGGWNFTGDERVKSNAPVSIVAPELLKTNLDLAESVMFD